jgi:hypothetical protein
VIHSRILRVVLLATLLGGVWLMLAGWATDSPRDRFIDASISAVVLLFALGVALPVRASWAFRIVAAVIGVTYLAYFGSELWDLLRGRPQPLRVGEPSVLMAGLGLLIIGVPSLLFALSGSGWGFWQHFKSDKHRKPDDGVSPPNGPAA